MKRFAITLSMIIVVAAISGCKTTSPEYDFYSGVAAFGYPACKGKDPSAWHQCAGYRARRLPNSNIVTWQTATYIAGKRNGRSSLSHFENGEFIFKCENSISDGMVTGLSVCRDQKNKIISRDFYENGEANPAALARMDREIESKKRADQEAAYRQKCESIGFNPGTEKFGDCILRMMEMNSSPKTQTVIQNTTTGSDPAVRALLEEQKRQRELEGSLELMKKGLEMMQPPQSPTVRCTNNKATSTITCR